MGLKWFNEKIILSRPRKTECTCRAVNPKQNYNVFILPYALAMQVLREGMGQAANVTNKDTALDTVITNALIVDAVAGIIKADVGIKVCAL